MTKQHSTNEIIALWDDFLRPKDGDTFRHYKGGLYEIVATGFLEDTETPCVVYRSLERNMVWVRTAKNFLEDTEYNGQKISRFSKVESS